MLRSYDPVITYYPSRLNLTTYIGALWAFNTETGLKSIGFKWL